MARRPTRPEPEADDATPDWLAPGRRAPTMAPPAPTPRTFISWRAIAIAAAVVAALALGLLLAVDRLRPGDGAPAGEIPLIRAPDTPYKTRPEGPVDATAPDPGLEAALTPLPEPTPDPSPSGPSPTELLPPTEATPPAEPSIADAPRTAPPPRAERPATPSAPPAPLPSPGVAERSLRAAPPVVQPAAAPPASGRAAPAEPALAAAGSPPSRVALQLGAFSSPQAARAAASRAASAHPELGGLTPRLETVTRDGRTLTRLRLFVTAKDPDALCARLRASGQACLLAPAPAR